MEKEPHTTLVNSHSERRQKESRRVSISASTNDSRNGADRRQAEDRRGYFENLANPDAHFLSEIMTWLVDNTRGEWRAGANGHEPDDSLISCRIRFEEEADLDAFIAWLSEVQHQHS